jgi:plastocyanin
MVPLRRSPILVAASALALAFVGAGCGSSQPDLANGKRIFTGELAKGQKLQPDYQPCGTCHTLARSGQKGNQGPNLDAAFASARADGFTDRTIQGVVEDQVAHPRKSSIMPYNSVTGDDRRDVAAYVGAVAGKPGKDTGQLAAIGTPQNTKPIAEKGGLLTIPAVPSGQTKFASNMATATAGAIEIKMPNPSPTPHNIALQNGPHGAIVSTGGSSDFKTTLKPGKYTFYCQVPGHEAGGMKGTLVVK